MALRRQFVLCSLAVLLLPLARLSAATEGEWPQWRGPTQDGLAVGEKLIDSFPAGGPPVHWVRELGQGYSGFAVVNGKAYTQAQNLYQQSLFCLDADTGQTLWSYNYAWPYEGGLYPGPRSTPTLHKGRVYFCSPQGLVGCVSADEGKLLWSVNFTEEFGGRGTEFGYSASPLVVDGLVILPVGGEQASVVAWNADDGSLAWKAGGRPASYATPLTITWQQEPLVIVLMQNSLVCIHRQTGELWWEHPLSSGYDEHAAAPIYREPHLFISGPFRAGAEVFRLEKSKDPGRCQPVSVWVSAKLSNDTASTVLFENTLFGFDLREAQARLHRPSRGEFRALDFLTGKVRWSSAEPGHAQAIVAGGKLVLFNDRGEVILAKANSEKYEELGRVSLFADEVCWTGPALANGRLFVRTQTRAACLYLGKEPLPSRNSSLSAAEIPRHTRFDASRLLGAGRDYSTMMPKQADFQRWFGWSIAAIAIATLLAGCARLAVWMCRRNTANPALSAIAPGRTLVADVLFWLVIVVAGVVGSPLLNHWQTKNVFLWPLALWAAFQLALLASFAGSKAPFWSRQRGVSYACGLLFLALCGLYFHLCRSLGLAIEWAFLTGFGWSFPIAALAAWIPFRRFRCGFLLESAAWLASFSVYYWSSIWFVQWWLRGDS